MAITYAGNGGVAYGTTAGTSPALPSSWQQNDIWLLFVETALTSQSSAPTGWSVVPGAPQGADPGSATTRTALSVYWKRAGASESAPSLVAPSNHNVAIIHGFRGCITSQDPFDVTPQGGTNINLVNSGSAPGVTTLTDGCMVVVGFSNGTDTTSTSYFSGWANSSLASLTEQSDNMRNAGNGGGLGIATGELATAGATGTTTVNFGGSAAAHAWLTIPLKPEPGGSGGGGTATPGNLLSYNAESAETDGTAWVALSNATYQGRVAAHAVDGTYALQFTSSAAGLASVYGTPDVTGITAGTQYEFYTTFWTGTAGLSADMWIDWRTSSGTWISSSVGTSTPLTQNGLTKVSITATAPATAAQATLGPEFTATAAGQVVTFDQTVFREPVSGASGTMSAAAPVPSASIAGTVSVSGSTAASSPLPTSGLNASVTATGTTDPTAPKPQAAFSGAVTVAGTISARSLLPVSQTDAQARVDGILTNAAPVPAAQSTGIVSSTGTTDPTAPKPQAAFSGAVTVAGTISARSLLPVSQTDAQARVEGILTNVGPAAAASAVGEIRVPGILAATAPKPTAHMTGGIGNTPSGTMTASAPKPQAAFSGAVTVAGTISARSLLPVSQTDAQARVDGILTNAAPVPAAQTSSVVTVSGSTGSSAPAPAADSTGTVTVTAEAAANSPMPTSQLAGTVQSGGGYLNATAPIPHAAFAAEVEVDGVLAATAPAPRTGMTGRVTAPTIPGVLDATAPVPTGTFEGTVSVTAVSSGQAPSPGASDTASVTVSGVMDAIGPPLNPVSAVRLSRVIALESHSERRGAVIGARIVGAGALVDHLEA